MANPEHVALLQQGPEVLTAWREAHPEAHLDLEKADLEGLALRGVNLQGAKLHGARLHQADLTGANLQYAGLREAQLLKANLQHARLQHARLVKANLEQADMSWARLYKAHLHGAYLPAANFHAANLQGAYLLWAYLVGARLDGAYLQQADLQWANLQGATLAGANLQGADLYESVVGHTTFEHTNLTGARGLDTCRHQGTSTLDLGTLTQSGALPEHFLRGCGWSVDLIANVAGLLQERTGQAVIERTMVFPALSQQAGFALLTYFGTILHRRHPEILATIDLRQEGMIVRLRVETPTVHSDTVVQTLGTYGLVVAGQQNPADVFDDPAQAQHLQRQLEVAETVWRLTHDTLPPAESLRASQAWPAAQAFRSLRQLVGNALSDM